jgi:anti-sigma factor RsiW
MNIMDCKDIKALLSAIIDDELDAEHRHAAERHLSECADCRAIINEAEGLNDLIALDARTKAGAPSMPMSFEQGVLKRTVYANGSQLRRHRWSVWSGWFVAAAASLALVAVLWVGDRQQHGDSIAAIGGQSSLPATAGTAAVVRPAAYTTGVNLRSQTFDGGLPAEAFRIHRASLSDVTIPFDPVFDWQDEAAREVEQSSARATAPISSDDADTLYSASLLIEMFADADVDATADIDRIRRVIEIDELLPRIKLARERMSGQEQLTVFAAESVLARIAHGSLQRDEMRTLQQAINRMNLAAEIEAMSER